MEIWGWWGCSSVPPPQWAVVLRSWSIEKVQVEFSVCRTACCCAATVTRLPGGREGLQSRANAVLETPERTSHNLNVWRVDSLNSLTDLQCSSVTSTFLWSCRCFVYSGRQLWKGQANGDSGYCLIFMWVWIKMVWTRFIRYFTVTVKAKVDHLIGPIHESTCFWLPRQLGMFPQKYFHTWWSRKVCPGVTPLQKLVCLHIQIQEDEGYSGGRSATSWLLPLSLWTNHIAAFLHEDQEESNKREVASIDFDTSKEHSGVIDEGLKRHVSCPADATEAWGVFNAQLTLKRMN